MKKKTYLSVTIGIMIVILILTFIDDRLPFFKFNTSPANAGFSVNKSAKSDLDGQLLWFTYDDGDIELNMNMLLEENEVGIYALTLDGFENIEVTQMKTTKAHTGSFIAYTSALAMDMNGDGNTDNVHVFAKTDTIATQGFAPVNTKFLNSKIPFEVTLNDRNTIILYYNQRPVSSAKVTVNLTNGTSKEIKTDEKGKITDLTLREIRKGVNFTFAAPDGEFYVMSYQVEDNTLFDNRHMTAFKPVLFILLIALTGVIVIIIIRDRKGIVTGFKRYRFKDTIASLWDIIAGEFSKLRNLKMDFMTLRWLIMIISTIFLVYGGTILGGWLSHIEIPTFACPQNQDSPIPGSCYALSHWDYLFTEHSAVEIIIFFVSFFVFVIIFGRALCGFVCPFGLLQDVIYQIRQIFRLRGLSFNEKIFSILKLVKWQILIIFLGAWALGINFCNFCPAIIMSPAMAGFKLSVFISGFVAIVVIILSFFKRRFWCNICPLGYLVGLLNKISLFRLKKNCQSCTECGACYEACPMGIKSIYTERKKEDITTSDCIMCGECVKKCPENDAIAISFAGKKIYIASRFKFFNKKEKK